LLDTNDGRMAMLLCDIRFSLWYWAVHRRTDRRMWSPLTRIFSFLLPKELLKIRLVLHGVYNTTHLQNTSLLEEYSLTVRTQT